MKVFSADYLVHLTQEAKISTRLRQHRNIHVDYQEPCQRLFNAIETQSYIRPHRHMLEPRDELLIAIRGFMALFLFDDHGQIEHVLKFGTEKYVKDISAGAEVPSHIWHTVIALEAGSILLEVKAGPFNPDQPKEFAPWAPIDNSEEAILFLETLRAKVS